MVCSVNVSYLSGEEYCMQKESGRSEHLNFSHHFANDVVIAFQLTPLQPHGLLWRDYMICLPAIQRRLQHRYRTNPRKQHRPCGIFTRCTQAHTL